MSRLADIVTTTLGSEKPGRCVCGKAAGKECGRVHCVQRVRETALPPGPAHTLPSIGRTTPRRSGAD